MAKSKTAKPKVIELDGVDETSFDAALIDAPEREMVEAKSEKFNMGAVRLARPMHWSLRLFWTALISLILALLVNAIWVKVTELILGGSLIGYILAALSALVLMGVIFFILRELSSFTRLRRIDDLQKQFSNVPNLSDKSIEHAINRLTRLYRGRANMRWALAKFSEEKEALIDVNLLAPTAERIIMKPLDD